ncbi:MAG: NTP transferase domain-containing protein [Candidatus Lokiarchaeota archaeon]|nr:NTP transferase domain-containing protein [Candidatus Lokiarchaeota archaeon]
MKAVIMAGGKGTRLRPLTTNLPKPLVPIINTPMIIHTIKLLKKHNFDEIYITISYLGKKIADLLGHGSEFGVSIKYYYEERPLGTAGGVRQISELDDTFLVVSSDIITDINLSDFFKFHKNKGGIGSIALTKEEIPVAYGIVITDENTKEIKRFLEKPGWSEVFSDKINAGIYLLEPEILKFVEKGVEYDFSHQLFPRILENNEKLFGYTFDKYWLDVGTTEKYLKAHHDILNGKIDIEIPGRQMKEGVWVGEGTEIMDGVNIWGPALIGKNSKIDNDSFIDRNTIIGDNVLIRRNNQVKKSIIWDGATVNESCKLNSCIIANRVEIGSFTNILENAVIGDFSTIHSASTIKQNVKIWPEKIIESNSIVNDNIKWGTYVRKSLFGPYGLYGLVNVEITPEFCAKLAVAFGTHLGVGSNIAIGMDTRSLSSMVRRAMISGLMSSGINAYDLGIISTPILKFAIKKWNLDGGIAISVPYSEETSINIRFFDENGYDINKNTEKTIENNFFKENFYRATPYKIGKVTTLARAEEGYINQFLKFIDGESIKENPLKVVIDLGDGSASYILPKILRKLNCEIITLNSQLGEEIPIRELSPSMDNLSTLSKTTRALEADIGLALDESANKVLFVDEKGKILSGDTSLALLTKYRLEKNGASNVVVPITCSNIINNICKQYDSTIIRTKMGFRPIIDDMIEHDAIFGGNDFGGYIFPEIQLCEDGIVSSIFILELLNNEGSTLSEIVSSIPQFYMEKSYIDSPIQYRGKIMNTLIEENYTHKIETISGIKIYFDYGWCLIIPDPAKSGFDIYAEAKNNQYANQLIKHWKNQIKNIIHRIETDDI